MFRFIFSMVFYVVVARWLYVEASILVPGLTPYLDHAVTSISIPPHTRWGGELERVKAHLNQFRNTPRQPNARMSGDWLTDTFGE